MVSLESLEELFEEACAVLSGERPGFLSCCSEYPEARAELASLLAGENRLVRA